MNYQESSCRHFAYFNFSMLTIKHKTKREIILAIRNLLYPSGMTNYYCSLRNLKLSNRTVILIKFDWIVTMDQLYPAIDLWKNFIYNYSVEFSILLFYTANSVFRCLSITIFYGLWIWMVTFSLVYLFYFFFWPRCYTTIECFLKKLITKQHNVTSNYFFFSFFL